MNRDIDQCGVQQRIQVINLTKELVTHLKLGENTYDRYAQNYFEKLHVTKVMKKNQVFFRYSL